MKITVVTCCNQFLRDWAPKDIFVIGRDRREYCEKNGYSFVQENNNICGNGRSILWNRHRQFLDLISSGFKTDWFVWMDFDTVFANHDIKLESFVDENFDMVMGWYVDSINDGVYFIRNNEATKKYLQYCWNREDTIHHGWGGMKPTADYIQLAQEGKVDFRTKIVPGRSFNSFYYPGCTSGAPCINPFFNTHREVVYQEGDFVIHMPGYGDCRTPIKYTILADFIRDKK